MYVCPCAHAHGDQNWATDPLKLVPVGYLMRVQGPELWSPTEALFIIGLFLQPIKTSSKGSGIIQW